MTAKLYLSSRCLALLAGLLCASIPRTAGAAAFPDNTQRVDSLLGQMSLTEQVDQLNASPRNGSPTAAQNRDPRYGLPALIIKNGARGVSSDETPNVCFPGTVKEEKSRASQVIPHFSSHESVMVT